MAARDYLGQVRSGTAYSHKTFIRFSFFSSCRVHIPPPDEVCHIHPLLPHLLRSRQSIFSLYVI